MFPKPTKKLKKPKKLGRKSKNPHKRAHDRAWDAISLYIRMSNADINGNVKCFTCDKAWHYKEIDAGHFLHGNNMDFIEENIHPQCTACNRYRSGNAIEYTVRMIKLYGNEFVEELIVKKHQINKYGIQDLRDLEIKYKELLNNL